MNPHEISTFVDRVLADAERAFGPGADRAQLHRYAVEAVQDLWLARPRVTVFEAGLALRQIREAIERLPAGCAA